MSVHKTHINVKIGSVLHYAMFTLVLFAIVFLYSYGKDQDAHANEEIQTINIFPGFIESTSWVNITTLFVQDVGEDAILENFNPGNSAFIQGEHTELPVLATTTEGVVEENTATSTEEIAGEEIATTTDALATTTEEVGIEDSATTTESVASTTDAAQVRTATSTEEEKESFGEAIIDAIVDFFDGSEETATTTDQEASVILFTPEEEGQNEPEFSPQNTSTTTSEDEITASSTISSLWGVLKNIFSNIATAQVGTSTDEEVVEEEPVVEEEEVSTTTEGIPDDADDSASSADPNTDPSVLFDEIFNTATTTDTATTTSATTTEPVQEPEAAEEPVEEPAVPEDTIPPVIEVLGNNPAYIEVGAEYADLGAIIPEVRDSNLSIRTFVNGEEMKPVVLDTSTDAVYTITYQATDIAGNVGEAERTVVVGEPVIEEVDTGETDNVEALLGPASFCTDGNEGCVRHSIEFSGFDVAEFLHEQTIENAQLRFSLGGRAHPGSEAFEEGIVVEYFFEGVWRNSGTIAFIDEVSNAINGGYFLYALPLFEDWSSLEELKVRITYENANGVRGDVYLDSLWLEVETQGLNQEEEIDEVEVVNEEYVEQKFDLELLSGKNEFETDELPTFRFKYREKKGVLGTLADDFLAIFGDPYKNLEISATVHGVDADVVARYDEDGEFVVDFLSRPRFFKPGRNLIELSIIDGKNLYTGTYEFFWGVLAVNVDKSIYKPLETAYIQMGVVDEAGHTVCNADLELEILKDGSPIALLTTDTGTIAYSNQCDGDSFVEVPDYFAFYDIPEETGVYDLKLIATTKNGAHTVFDSFEVKEEIAYDILRTGPTRIYPLEPYPVTVTVTARKDFEGIIEERVPVSFEVNELEGVIAYDGVRVEEGVKVLTWNVSLPEGESLELGYTFDAPDVSPAFYLIGPLRLVDTVTNTLFAEKRQWQIASDTAARWGRDDATGFTGTGSAHSRSMGGTSPSQDGMIIESVSIFLGAQTGDVRLAVYESGDLDDPNGAHLLWDAGTVNPGGTQGWYTINHPSGGVAWASATTTWIAWKRNTGVNVFYSTASTDSGDFQTARGRNDNNFSQVPGTAYPATYSDTGTFANFWYAMYVTYTTPDVTVATTGTQVPNLSIDSQDNYVGGTFSFSNASSTALNITEVTITETGTVDAQNDLSNIRIYYENDTSNPYDCASESYDGTESQYGATSTSFSSANGTSTFSGSVAITTTSTMCGYVVLDVDASASVGETIDIEINDPSTEVLVSGSGRAWPDTTIGLAGSTTLLANVPPAVPTLAATSTFENMRATTTLPLFGLFSTTDFDGDDVQYEFAIDDDYLFESPATTTHSVNFPGGAGWASTTFASGSSTQYVLQSADALANGTTYWWSVRAQDPSGSGLWSASSTPRAITIATSLDLPQWYETTGFQFADDTLTRTASTTGGLEIANDATVSLLDAWSTGNTKTISSGNDRLLIVTVQSEDSGTSVNVNTVTYGGITMTEIADQQVGTGFSNGLWMGYLTESQIQNAVGTTITPTWTGGTPDNGILYSSATFENVDQASPIRAFSQNFDTVGATIQIADAIAVADGDFVVYGSVNGSTGLTHTPDTGYTEGTEEDAGGTAHVAATAYRAITADGTEQPTATWSGSGNRMAIIGATLAANFATGTIMSTEIDYDWVPEDSDGNWGEITWNTTEPSGASTSLQVYYTSSSACDTIVPNSAIPGNSAGFSANASPLDISSISTTTYNQICLRMELNHGSTTTSPTLDDWTVSWERNPILSQNYYRLFANENAEPPTDQWAPGIESDLEENQPMTASIPIDNLEVLRIRMSVNASSSPANAGDLNLKLQYGAGNLCSAITDWIDVGAIGSTTAAWRGYDNTSVGHGATLSSTTLSVSDVFETYIEGSNATTNPNTIGVGQDGEYDFAIQSHQVTDATNYCFRLVTSDGTELDQYIHYPQAYTNESPAAPTLNSPFDNEALASSSPWFDFLTTDFEGEPIHYQVQVDNNVDFSSTVIDATSINDETAFQNLDTPSDKAPYNSGQEIRFTSTTTLTDNTTYWWRVRSIDTAGSNQYGDWSTAQSFTASSTVSISTWYQNTIDQFETDNHLGTDATTTNQITLLIGSTTGTTTSSAIDFDDGVKGTANAWGEVSWGDTEPGGSTITYYIEYFTSTSSWELIPNSDLAGNESGFTTAPINLLDLNTATYNQIRLRADFVDAGTAPSLQSWQVTWGERVSVPTHILPFDNEKFVTTTPDFTFFSTDPQSDDLRYQFSYSVDNTFTSSTTFDSDSDSGFTNRTTLGDANPFNSGDTIEYQIQSALSASTTYWWRTRAMDPAGSASWSFWSSPWSFTTASSTENFVVSTWFQDTQEQFETNTHQNTIASTTDAVEIPTSVDVAILDAFTTGNTKTISAGTNRLLVVSVHTEDSGTSVNVNTVTYGGQTLTEVDDEQVGGGFANGLWVGYLDEAGIQAASGNTIVPSYIGGTPDNGVLYSSAVLQNVDQTTPVSAWSGNTGTTQTTIQATTSIAVSDGDMALYFTTSGANGQTHTPAANYTEGTEEDAGGNAHVAASAYRAILADGTEQPTADWTNSINRLTIVSLTVQKALSVTSGTVRSTAIDFDDGDGPRWDDITWNDETPGASSILYQVEYFTSTSSWNFVPDTDLPGNSAGTSTQPIDISGLSFETYNQLRLVGNLLCDGSNNCPQLADWTLRWGPGITISGTAQEYDQSTNVTSGTVAVAVNGQLQEDKTGTISAGSWSIANVTAFAGDTITVFIDGATDEEEAVAVTKYATGTGDIAGMQLFERHLSIGSDQNASTTNADLGQFDLESSGDEDVFFSVDSNNDLLATTTGAGFYEDVEIYIQSGDEYRPDNGGSANVETHDMEINGEFILDGNTATLTGSWDNNGGFDAGTSLVLFTATNTTESIDSTGAATSSFNNLTLGTSTGSAIWNNDSTLDVDGDFIVNYGTLAASTSEIMLAGNLTIETNGVWTKGPATTTFNGSVAKTWTDNTTAKQDLGTIVIDGASKTVNLGSHVALTDLTIGANDTLNVTTGHYDIEVFNNWTNNNVFTAQQGTVLFATTSISAIIDAGGSSFYNLTFRGTGGGWSFVQNNLTVTNDFSVASGTVTMAVGTTTVGGSFTTTDTFVHNNGLVLFNSGSSGETITASTSPFYNIVFDNTDGGWTFQDTSATSSNDVRIFDGIAVMPSDTMAVGNSLLVTDGTLSHNEGTVRMYAVDAGNTITLGGNNLYTLLIDGAGGGFAIADTNATTTRNLTISAGTLTFPSGALAVGGNFANSDAFTHNNGTVRFFATTTGFAVDPGSSSFYDALFDSETGGWTIGVGATTTNNLSLINADTFIASSFLEVGGVFSNQIGGASTTWTGSTLFLNSGTDYGINAKTIGGDSYSTLSIGANTDIDMWNSTSTIYIVDSTGSLYSQDHNGTDGDLYIWGDYLRSSGNDYWSYATDFDGTDLTGSERQVDVLFAGNATATYIGGTLEVLGTSSASTTINNQGSGNYSVVTGGLSTLNAGFYAFRNLDQNGLTITGSTTITSLADGDFELTLDGGSTITLGPEVIAENPVLQIERVRFATTTLITGSNVTATGTPSSFWWFRNHYGNLDGEDFDTDPGGNPGNVRWDDSNNSVIVAGFVYEADGATVSSACDGATPVVTIVVDGGTSYTGACAGGTGAYSIPGVGFVGDPVFTVYLDAGDVERAATITRTPTVDIEDLNLYENTVIVRHEDANPLSIANMAVYDSANDSDIPFAAATGSPDTLTLEPETELFISATKTFIPGGNITIDSGGSGGLEDGSLRTGTSTTLTFANGESHSFGGSFVLDTTTVFTPASTTLTFTATTTGKSIAATSTLALLVFNGTGGEWTIASTTNVSGNINMTAGTMVGSANITVQGGHVTGDGDINLTGGTFSLEGSGTFGGATDWTFNNLTFGDGSTVATTTKTGTGAIDTSSVLTIDTNHILDAGSSEWILSGGGTPFVINGTFDANNSLFTYSGTIGTDVRSTTYHDLTLAASGGTPTYSILGGTLLIDNAFTIGDGITTMTANSDTFDPTVTVGGTTTINQNATFVGSNVNTYTAGASWFNFGTFTHANGTVLFSATTTGHIVAASTSPFFNTTFDSATGGWTITEHATSANNFNLNNASSFAVSPNIALAVSGQFSNGVASSSTTWTDSILFLNSGTNYTINTKTFGDDIYGVLIVGDNTDIRMWNSDAATATTAVNGSLYSQDHALMDGDLYIWGDYVRSSGNDYWSYATDFDGIDLSGGNERQANVYLSENATTTLSGDQLNIIGASTASTTIQNQGTGTYALAVTGGTFNAQYYVVRDITTDGVNISGSPTITNLSNGDFLLEINGGTMMTIAGATINANTGKTFSSNIFATSSGISSGFNVTATGASVGSIRFTGYSGNYGGESFDSDPGGDPGYVVWDDSDSNISISGTVYTDEGITAAGAPTCNGSNQTVHLSVQGAAAVTTSCDGSGNYSFSGITFNPGDVIAVYLDSGNGATFAAANITVDPLTNISNMHLYQDRVIVRHEDTSAITNTDLAICDSSSCDSDIPFDVTGSNLVSDAGTEIHVWDSKSYAPGGNITLHGNAGAEPDGTLHVAENASFIADGGETHTIAGSFNMMDGGSFTASTSAFIFNATTTGKIISATSSPFYDLTFNGSGGAWSFPPNTVETVRDFTITAGSVTLGTGTTTVGGSFDNTGGTFSHNNGLVYLIASSSGQTIEAGGSDFYNLTLADSAGGWTWQDTNATTSNDFVITSGSTTLPTGTFAVGGSFDNTGGTINHAAGTIRMYSSAAGESFRLNSSTVNDLTFDGGGGGWTFEDFNATSTGDISILAGSVTMASGTMAVSGSFANSGGSFDNATGTLRLYGPSTGETLQTNGSLLYQLVIDSVTGGWTIVGNATTSNTFDLLSSDTFAASGFIESQGEFTNLVGGASTTWTGSTLFIRSGTNYSVNTKSQGGDSYDTLIVGSSATSTDLRFWNSTSTIYTVQGTSSVYSQDHNSTDGDLYIWGQYERESGTDYWSYATDFDGTDISGGSERQVNVYLDQSATTTIDGGTLNVVGVAAATTTIQNQGAGAYGLSVTDGTFNASYYQLRNMNALGLNLSGSSTVISSLSNGDFELSANGGNMLTVSSTTIDNNATLQINGSRFATSSGISSGFNASIDSQAQNAWNFNSHYGNYDGEANDDDGGDACGSFRWDDSTCLFVSQEHFRWRNDDGGEAVPTNLWFDSDWTKRQKITFTDTATTTSSNVAVEITVPFDSDMQADFDDLRFTDESGTTTIDYWIESFVSSDSAIVWVEIPSLPSLDTAFVYMYYGSSTAPDASSGTSTFLAFDDFEDNDILEYSGDTGDFETSTSFNFEGSYGLDAAAGSETAQTTDGIFGTTSPLLVSQGQTIRFFQYLDMSSGADDEPCFLFGVQDPGTDNLNYAVCLDPFNTDQVVLTADVSSNDASGSSTLSVAENVTFTTGWYEVEIDWFASGTIDVTVYDDDVFFASTTGTNTVYSSGAVGFSFWAQHGGWDLVTSRNYIASAPTYAFGFEQENNGATWAASEDTILTGQDININQRVRFTVNNTGAAITDQNFRLQYAAKGAALSCESVSGASFADVPVFASCGASPVCMSTSTNFTNLASTTELLSVPSGSTFTYGQIVEDASNETGDIDVGQNAFTEVEYVFQMKGTVSDSNYCFRTTDDGTALDNYTNVAELSLTLAPIITSFTLNSAQDIVLTPGATTTVHATGTAIDLNGFADLDFGTSTYYRELVAGGNDCTANDNNCYQVANTSCSFSMCSGNSCELQCTAGMLYHADPTDIGSPFAAEEWLADLTVVDQSGLSDTGTTLGVEVLTLRAITASSSIPYGSLAVNSDTGNYNATTTVTNDGNDNIDVSLSGTDLTFGASAIGVTNQLYATSTFTYSSCGVLCTALSTTSTQLEVDLFKPTSSTSPITDAVYWGLFVPTGTAAASHEGTNTFTAVGD